MIETTTELTPLEVLPQWSNVQRGIPNALARSALFNTSSVRKGDRENCWKKVIPSPIGTTMIYSGMELRSDDCDVYLQVLHMVRMDALGDDVSFTAHQFLLDLGWPTSGPSYQRLADCLYNLTAATVSFTIKGRNDVIESYTGSLIRRFRTTETPEGGEPLKRWIVSIEPQSAALFGPSKFSKIAWGVRMELSPLGKWLLNYYSTHAVPYPIKVSTLHELCGSECKVLKKWRQMLKESLETLVKTGFLLSATVDKKTDLVHVTRKHQKET